MRSRVTTAFKTLIPLFAGKPAHPAVPLGRRTAGAHNEGQGRQFAGASRSPLTAESTLAGWRRRGNKTLFRCAVVLALGAFSLSREPGGAIAQSMPIARAPASEPYADHITEASQRFGIPVRWIRAVLRTESAGDAHAVSTAGAMGLMQVMPGTWADLRVRYQLGRDPYQPRDNILAGAAYLREMWDRYGNVAAMLAAYNAGPDRYDDHRATGRPLPAETRAYIATLAPDLGGSAASAIHARQPASPRNWRDAPLFVPHPNDSGTTAMPSFATQSGDLFAAVSGPDRR